MGTPAQTPSVDTRYLRNDIRLSAIKKEQRELWEAHYPIGHLLPENGAGRTVGELRLRVQWYCKTVGINYLGGVEDAVEELARADLIKLVKSE